MTPRRDQRSSNQAAVTLLLILGALSPACYENDYTRITVTCSIDSPSCPPGFRCEVNTCVSLPPADGGSSQEDASMDLSQTGDLAAQSSICPGGGDKLIGSARGCPGTFQAGKAALRCPSGWAPCAASTKVDLQICQSLPSFFAGAQSGYYIGTMSNEMCGSAVGNQLFYGCGSMGRASTAKCGGLPRVIDVTGSWSATDGTLSTAALTDPNQGVLCCPP